MTYQEALRQERRAYSAWVAACDAWVSDDPRSTDYRLQRSAARAADTAYEKATDALAKARALLPPPKPNAQVLATAIQNTHDGLGWGFEHQAIEQDIAYRKWLKKASKRPSDLE